MTTKIYDFNPRKFLDEVAADCTSPEDRAEAARFVADVSTIPDPLVSIASMVRSAVNAMYRDGGPVDRSGFGIALLLCADLLCREILKVAE